LVAKKFQEQGVRFALVQFADMDGAPKGKLVPIEHWDSLVTLGAGFAGPSIVGTGLPRTGPRSEYYARIDEATARVMPWSKDTVHVIGDGFVDGQPFDGCPRQVLRRATERLAQLGLKLNVGIEPEFFLFDSVAANNNEAKNLNNLVNDKRDRLDKPSYDLQALLKSPIKNCLYDLHAILKDFGFNLLQIDHEDAPAQYEVNYEFDTALNAADQFMRFKIAAHAIAQRHGFLFSLMPKPFADRPGSGLHFHLSLEGGNEQQLQQATAGLLKHAAALACIHAPTVNSYKRLVSQGSASGTTWAPTHICHGANNRSAIARTLPGRVEWRIPDPTTNVYLALAAVIHAMIDGLENKLVPAPAINEDISEWTLGQLAQHSIKQLPNSLWHATLALEADKELLEQMGKSMIDRLIEHKRQEWRLFNSAVHTWELETYLHRQ
jgi:glutamine synthetase